MEQQLQRIQGKLQQLIRQHQVVQKERDQLRQEKEKLTTQLSRQIELTLALEQQLEAHRIQNQVTEPEDRKHMDRKLGQYIREIDRCIALLSE
jgi:hypothetical protein